MLAHTGGHAQVDQFGEPKLDDIPDGLTPPLKNVKNRRFRKTAPKQHDNTPEGRNRTDTIAAFLVRGSAAL